MIETSELHYRDRIDVFTSVQPFQNKQDAGSQRDPGRKRVFGRVLRFGLVGGVNTVVDLLLLNILLLLFPTNRTPIILVYSALAYSLGAVNSFLLNKFWTFGYRQRTTLREVVRFIVTTLCGIGWSSGILWLTSNALHPLLINTTIWANVSKVIAISGTAVISYLGMSLWVFVNKTRTEHIQVSSPLPIDIETSDEKRELPEEQRLSAISGNEQSDAIEYGHEAFSNHSISVVLPAYNEEQVIASTVAAVVLVLDTWHLDFEVLVVNDGSIDRTGEIVAALVNAHSCVRLITHASNEGYGASLVNGFAGATKELTFFMDSDGQFDIQDLQNFFPLIDTYDAVIGYRLDRQDSWLRKLNAWGWKQLLGLVLDVHVRDMDCAFKLLRTEFLHQHPLETRGAMINAELLYRLTRAGCSYKEIGVHHLPRLHGSATGARLNVILLAFRELFVSARMWRREEKELANPRTKSGIYTRS